MLAVAAQKKRTLKFCESDNSDESDEESTIESDCESDPPPPPVRKASLVHKFITGYGDIINAVC